MDAMTTAPVTTIATDAYLSMARFWGIAAECHTDDRVYEVNFDARPWFEQASEEEILDLARCGWGGNYPSDQVAIDSAEWSDEVSEMFRYIYRKNSKGLGDTIGFECHVESKDAYKWLEANRPGLVAAVRTEDPDED